MDCELSHVVRLSLVAFWFSAFTGCATIAPPPDAVSEDRLDKAPYRVQIDAKKIHGEFRTTLDLSKFDPEKKLTVFMEGSDESSKMYLYHPENGERVAEASRYGEVDDEDGLTYVWQLRVDPGRLKSLELVATTSSSTRMWAFLLCDEVVRNRSDTGAGSLRQAIADVQNDGSVCFDPIEFGSSNNPVQLSGEILVGKDVHIHGTGRFASQITTGGQDRIFQFGIGTDTSLHRLGINDGAATEGGLIKSRGVLEIENCELHSGRADRGGAVYSEGDLYIDESTVSSSQAEYGGGIYNDGGLVHLVTASVHRNEATYGGGIYGASGSFRLQHASLIHANTATHGGGVYIEDQGISGLNSVWGGSIMNNGATLGGGVYMSGGQLEIDFNPRSQYDPKAIATNHANEGGGVYVSLGAFLDVKLDNAIWSNRAANKGGGIYNGGEVRLTGSAMVEENQSSSDGGGVYNAGQLEMFGASRVADNWAHRSGGGVYNARSGSLKIWDSPCRIESNAAVTAGRSGAGGGVLNEGGTLDYLSHEIVNNTPNDVVDLP